jgi:hypothetical protein
MGMSIRQISVGALGNWWAGIAELLEGKRPARLLLEFCF